MCWEFQHRDKTHDVPGDVCVCVCGGGAYTTLRSTVQKKLRGMQEDWWRDKARELQDAADRHDTKAFYHNLTAVYWPRDIGSIPVRSSDGTTLITDREGILSRWAEHFHGVLNQPSTFDP